MPVRSPYPLMQPWTWLAPASMAASEFATAQPLSLCAWIPTRTPVVSMTSCTTSETQSGQHPAVGVAQGDDLGAGVVRRPEHLERVVAVGAVAVEEVLGVQEHLLPLGAQVGDGVADHGEVLLEGGPQGELDVPVVRLGDQGDHRRTTVTQRSDLRVVGGGAAGPARGAEGRQLRVLEVELDGRASEELGVLRVRARPAALDVAHAEAVELPRDRQLVGDREVEPLLLRAVAQGGVVDVEGAVQVHRSTTFGTRFPEEPSFARPLLRK